MHRKALFRLLPWVLAALVGCSDSNDDDDDAMMPAPPPAPPPNTTDFDADLNAAEVVGGGVTGGSAAAAVTVNLDDGSISGTVTLTNVDADTVSLHGGFAGERGMSLIDLQEDSATEWSFPSGAVLSEADLDALQAGGLYLQVTTASAPEGALRGQIVPDGVDLLFVSLSGMQQVPPLETSTSATAALTLEPADGSLQLHLNTSGLDDAAEAHIHEALAGVNGPITVGLVQDPDDVAHWSLSDFTLDQAQLDALAAGRLYLNVHTPANPPGEVRGQIEPEGVEIFFTSLSGADVVMPVTTDATGVAAATLTSSSRSLVLHANLLGLDDAQSVTVRQAPVMQNGPEVLALAQDANAVAHWSLGPVTLSDSQHEALRNQGLYVQVATPAFPNGEVRGQLVPDMSMPATGDAFVVSATVPDDGATVSALPAMISATFNRDVLAGSAGTGQVNVSASGGDGSFGDGNEVAVGVLAVNVSADQLTADVDSSAATDDVYRLVLDGSSADPITDLAGTVLDGDGDGNPGGDFVATFTVSSGSSAPTLSQLQTDIFTPSCAKSGCHGGSTPAQGMNLSAGQTFSNTVGVAANEVPSLDRIEPGNPDDSYLVRKVEGTASVGGRMPLDGPPFLTNAQIQAIRDWVAAGAQDN